VPLIARVNGACMAGGMGLMAMCDMAVAAPHAIFGLPEVKVGVFPAQVLSVLNGLIGQRALTELCITGEPINAHEALSIGLINHVAEDLDAGVQTLLDRFLDKSPAAIRRGLYLMKRISAMSFEESMAFTESQIALFALTEDAAEGQAAARYLMKDERPSLLFWADHDPALPLDPVGRAVQMLFPMAEPLTVIENAGHFLQEDHGEEIGRQIATWLDRTAV